MSQRMETHEFLSSSASPVESMHSDTVHAEDLLCSTSVLGSSKDSASSKSSKSHLSSTLFGTQKSRVQDTPSQPDSQGHPEYTGSAGKVHNTDTSLTKTDTTTQTHTSKKAPIPLHVQSHIAKNAYVTGSVTGSRQPAGTATAVCSWLATQSNMQYTPATSTVPAALDAPTVSSVSLGMDANVYWPPESSQISRRSRSSKRTHRSSLAKVMLNFGTQITSNLMSMAEASRQEAARREELLRHEALAIRQEALEKDKIALAREQMFAQREDQLLESEQKRQKINAEMQIEIERQRAAVQTNRMMVNNEIMERREAEYVLRKEQEKQELLGLKENEKLEMKACYEQQIALERRLSEEKENA